jgi:hypothetical protein
MNEPKKSKLDLNRTILVKRFFLVFLPLVLVFALVSIYLCQLEISSKMSIVKSQEKHELNKSQKVISEKIRMITTDLMALTAHERIHELTFDDNQKQLIALQQEFLEFSRYKSVYDQARILDKTGMELVRVNYNSGEPTIIPQKKLQFKGKRYYFKDAFELSRDEIFISPLDLNIEHGKVEVPLKPMLRLGTPIFDKQNNKTGIILLNYYGDDLLTAIDPKNYPGSRQPMLVNSEGYWLKGLDPEDEWGFMYTNKKDLTFGNRFPAAWQRISQTEDIEQFSNENGLFTFTTLYPVYEGLKSSSGSAEPFAQSDRPLAPKEYYWQLILHISQEDLNNALQPITNRYWSIFLFLIFLWGGTSWYIVYAYSRREKLIENLEKAISEIKTLRGIIPICMHCKGIRDDKGSWNKIEKYISENSDAEFSHGICENCLEKHYPEDSD